MRATTVAVELELERDVERPRLLAQVRQRRRVLRRGAATRRRASAASGVTHGEIDVANDLARNGPSGWDSNACRSRALQSLSSTTPKTWSSASRDGDRLAVRARRADDEAELELDVEPRARAEDGGAVAAARRWPRGRRTGVPLDDDRARAPVVADRQVAPVRRQRVARRGGRSARRSPAWWIES